MSFTSRIPHSCRSLSDGCSGSPSCWNMMDISPLAQMGSFFFSRTRASARATIWPADMEVSPLQCCRDGLVQKSADPAAHIPAPLAGSKSSGGSIAPTGIWPARGLAQDAGDSSWRARIFLRRHFCLSVQCRRCAVFRICRTAGGGKGAAPFCSTLARYFARRELPFA